MATYTKETALYDTGAIKDGVDDAATKATAYLATGTTGIMVYDGRNGVQSADNPSSTTNNVFIDSDSLDIRKGTDVLATFGASGATIGRESNNDMRLALTNDGMTLYYGTGTNNPVMSMISRPDGDHKLDLGALFIDYDTTSSDYDVNIETRGNMSLYMTSGFASMSIWNHVERMDYVSIHVTGEYPYWDTDWENQYYSSPATADLYIDACEGIVWNTSGYSHDQQMFKIINNFGTEVRFGFGSGGHNHGIYSTFNQSWIIYLDENGYTRIPDAYGYTTTSAANVYVAVGSATKGRLFRSTSSSKRYKCNIEDIENAEALYDIPVRQFKYRNDYLSDDDIRYNKTIPGFIVEEMEKVYPIAVEYQDELPEDWNIRYLVPSMLKLIQDQHKEIEDLKSKVGG